MQNVLAPNHAAVPRSHGKPTPDSYDSGEEFSLYHLIEVSRLEEDGELSLEDEGLDRLDEIEKSISEMESATAR